ncbi:hypothetical protein RRG08_015715 [Elysia crispata]|uniref:Uncharacterized protein n=1 Tax=Elysia crispata TaxID=231223 RepID=A0AAE1D9Z6_9GAST|nr:hypothetical protein RRG08_015715 [Elysia crispata]
MGVLRPQDMSKCVQCQLLQGQIMDGTPHSVGYQNYYCPVVTVALGGKEVGHWPLLPLGLPKVHPILTFGLEVQGRLDTTRRALQLFEFNSPNWMCISTVSEDQLLGRKGTVVLSSGAQPQQQQHRANLIVCQQIR